MSIENVDFEDINQNQNTLQNTVKNELCNEVKTPLEQDLALWIEIAQEQKERIQDLQREIVAMVKTLRPFLPLLSGKDEAPGIGEIMGLMSKIPAIMKTEDFQNGTKVIQKYLPLIEH